MTHSSMISSPLRRFVRTPILTCSAMLGALLLATATPHSVEAQRSSAAGGASAQPYDSSLFAALKWRDIGPYRGGRSVAVAGSDKRPYEYWMGTTGGGVFKTTDGGHSWEPMSDKYFGGTIGAIGVSESNPDIVYVGTGEYDIRGNVSHGDGVWKTTDGGKSWTHVGLAETRQIARVKVDPRNPDVAYVGALGHVWAPNPERGVFKTTDGGKTWKKILFRNDSTGITDLVLDPNDPNTIYAAFWQAGRKPWLLVSGGAGSGIFKSTDGGEHWTELTRNPGLPRGIIGNIGITVSKGNSNILYANIEADSGGVFRSSDGGKTWKRTNEERKLRQRAWYYTRIFADPADTNTVYVLNVGFWRSTDGGKTFKSIRVPHGDNHDLWIASNDAKRMIEGNDGGANVSFDAGRSWSEQDFATAQFYHVTTTTDFPYKVCGAQQDNSTLCGPSAAPGGITMADWHDAGGGESGYIQVRPDSTNIIYAGSYAYLSRLNTKNGQQRNIIPWPDNPMGHAAKDLKYRFQWTFPILISPHDPNTLYIGSNGVFRSRNDGQSWEAISPDLTRHDPATLASSGGPITKDNTSVEYYATVFAIAESPLSNGKGTIWAGSDDGLIHLTRDGGAHWTDVTPKELPPWTRISIIEASHFDLGTAYVAANRYQLDDNQPYLYKTTDFGKTWTRIDAGMARDQFTRVIREDPARRGLLYVGTERGVWVSFDDGADWQPLQLNLPPVPVHDLSITEGDLVAATHGRSFWILDDLSPLRQLSREIASASSHLFEPRDVYRVQWGGGFGGGSEPSGANPPSGAAVYFTLANAKEKVQLEFLDGSGKVIRSFSSELDSAGRADSVRADSAKRARTDSLKAAGLSADSIKKLERTGEESEAGPRRGRGGPTRVPNKKGLNRFVWDLRYPDAAGFENLIMWAGSTRGPTAVPGKYSVRMTVNGETQTRSFTLLKDPRISATQKDLEAQFALLVKIRDTLSAANNAVKTIRNVKYQIDERKAKAPKSFASAAAPFVTRLSVIEDSIYQTKNRSGQDPLNYPIRLNNKIAALGGVVAGADFRPTDQSYVVFDTLTTKLNTQLVALHRSLTNDLTKLNAILKKAGQPEIVPRPVELAPQNAEADESGELEVEDPDFR
ncbi:MAG TPA: YCF48-related protein [Gemmatimonadaceae bacterium]|nr:YCF48-related protein [Gemmatimonadaceae bacterium]